MKKVFGKLQLLATSICLLAPSAAYCDQVLMQPIIVSPGAGMERLNDQIQNNPSEDAYLKRADAYRLRGRDKEAIDDINQAVHIAPNNTYSYMLRGRIYYDEGMYPEAITDVNQALKVDPNSNGAYILRAQSYFKLKDFGKALEDANTILKNDPKSAVGYLIRGASYNGMKKYDNAIDDCTKAINLDPNLAQAYYYRADSNHDQGNYKESIDDYTKALSLQDGYRAALLGRAWSNYQLDKTKEALADCSAAIKFDNAGELKAVNKFIGEKSTDADIQPSAEYNFGQQLEDDLKNALVLYNDVLHDKPGDRDALRDRGLVYMHLGKYKEAIRDFDAANKGLPVNPSDYSGLGTEEDYRAAKPDYESGNKNLLAGNYLQAIKDYRASLQKYPTYGRCWHNLGISCGDLGDNFTAELCVIHAISYRPDDPKLWYTLGMEQRWEYTKDKTDPQKLASSAAAFRQCLLLNPTSDEDKQNARHELAAVKDYERAIAPQVTFQITTMPVN
jgi:tetratricopeptide (TPR) repeat protein